MKRNIIRTESPGKSSLAKSGLGRKLLAGVLAALLAVGTAPLKVSVRAEVSGEDAAEGGGSDITEEVEPRNQGIQPGDIINFGHQPISVVLVENEAEEALENKPKGYYQYDGVWYYVNSSRVYPTIPIRWLVLEDEEDALLVIQEYILEGRAWDGTMNGDTLKWENSSIRSYINSDAYLQYNFTDDEINDIRESTVSNTAPGTNGETLIEDTQDRLFLPSLEEVNQYFETDADRAAHYYSNIVPDITTPMSGWGDAGAYDRAGFACAYWTRSPAALNYGFSKPGMVDCNGMVGTYSRVYNTWSLGIRPMMRISKDSVNYYRAPQNVELIYPNDPIEVYASDTISVKADLNGDYLTEGYQPYVMYTVGGGRIADITGVFSSSSGVRKAEATLYGLAPTYLEASASIWIKPALETIEVEAYEEGTDVNNVKGGLKIKISGKQRGDGAEIQRRTLPEGEWETIYASGSVGAERDLVWQDEVCVYKDAAVIQGQEYEYRSRGLFCIRTGTYSYSAVLEGMEAEWSEPVSGTFSNFNKVELPKAVKFAPYETKLPVDTGYSSFQITEGMLPRGLILESIGMLSGVPEEAGNYMFQVKVSGQSVTEKILTYHLTVEQNTDANIEISTDQGYELVEKVPDLSEENLPAQEEQSMRSVGGYEEFVALYLDGGKLIRGEGDTLTGDAEYLANPGSTRITILNQTLAKNGPGTHTLAMEFRKTDTGELRRAAQNYTIEEGRKPEPEPTETPEPVETPQPTDDSGNGDNGEDDTDDDWEDDSEDIEEEIPQPTATPQPVPTPQPTAVPPETVPENPYESAYFDYVVDWEAVGRMIDAAAPRQNIDVLAGGSLETPAWILEKCIARDVTLALHVGNKVTLSITGREIAGRAEKPFGIDMKYPAQIPNDQRESTLKGVLAGRVFEVDEANGAENLRYPVNVHFSWGSEYAGKQSVLYYYEKATDSMVPVGIFTVTQTGQAMFGISRSGGYIAVVFGDNPEAGLPGVHTVVSGDTMYQIAAKHKLTVDRLIKENPWVRKADRIYPRQKIVVR